MKPDKKALRVAAALTATALIALVALDLSSYDLTEQLEAAGYQKAASASGEFDIWESGGVEVSVHRGQRVITSISAKGLRCQVLDDGKYPSNLAGALTVALTNLEAHSNSGGGSDTCRLDLREGG